MTPAPSRRTAPAPSAPRSRPVKGSELTCVVSVSETQEPDPLDEPDELDELPEPLVQLFRDAVTFFTDECP